MQYSPNLLIGWKGQTRLQFLSKLNFWPANISGRAMECQFSESHI